jgi:membrane fusion protein (multidrug efflux system)
MKSKIIGAVFIVLAVVALVGGGYALQIKKLIDKSKTATEAPEYVSSFVAREEKWQGTLDAVGSVTTVQGVTITPEVAGAVRELSIESGALVKKGDVLVQLDTSVEEAQLKSLESQAALAKINLDREKTLRASAMNSQSDLDTAEATLKQTQASADALRATIAKKTIRAPFSGRLGIRQVNLGQYLDIGKAIVVLQTLAPIYVEFALPQSELGLLSVGMRVRLTTDAYPQRQFEGKLTAITPEVDTDTRNVTLQATLDNADEALRPGMFGRVEVLLPAEQNVLVIPATAVLSAPYGDSVYVIENKTLTNGVSGLFVRQQFIRAGRGRGDFLSVENGLKPGQKIVSTGLFKLRNDMQVLENNTLSPTNQIAPNPADS